MQAELKITFKDGQVNVTGPLQDKMVCYALLEMAKDAIRDLHAKNEQRVIPAAPTAVVPPNLRGL